MNSGRPLFSQLMEFLQAARAAIYLNLLGAGAKRGSHFMDALCLPTANPRQS